MKQSSPSADQRVGALSDDAIEELLPVVAKRAILVHPRRLSDADATGGGDFDCIVDGLDPLWPLRAPAGWRVLGCLQYDITGWYWILSKGDELVLVDTLEDEAGIGKYGFPTSVLTSPNDSGNAGARAAYLVAKRVLKDSESPAEWRWIRDVADSDSQNFGQILMTVFGPRSAPPLFEAVMRGEVPHRQVLRAARKRQLLRRFRTPGRALKIAALQVRRLALRLRQPTGMTVVIVGPDGTGKSTLAAELAKSTIGLFRSVERFHWRPGILPRPGAFLGRGVADATNPHGRSLHSKRLSAVLLGYYWADFLLGGWVRDRRSRVRTRLVIVERGWLDLAVDPARYRLDVHPHLVNLMNKALPQPDLTIVLGGPADTIRARKDELTNEELEAQMGRWKLQEMRSRRRADLDITVPAEDLAAQAKEVVLRELEKRQLTRTGSGWTALRSDGQIRWVVPRSPRCAARSAFSIYQPVTSKSQFYWRAARMSASLGCLRLTPRNGRLPCAVRELVAPFIPYGGNVALMRPSHPNRHIALILDRQGVPTTFCKIALDDRGREALEKEHWGIRHLGSLLPPPLQAPEVVDFEPGVLLTRAAAWKPRHRPWLLSEQVAESLGVWYATGRESGELKGLAHGDFAPWNLLRVADKWLVVDWESSRTNAPPFFDILHYIVQAHSLLKRPSLAEIGRSFTHENWISRALAAYAHAADRSPEEVPGYFEMYLTQTMPASSASAEADSTLAARKALLGVVSSFT